MPKIKVNDINMNYEQQGTEEPLVLIPYLAADNACYAFQVADYAKHFFVRGRPVQPLEGFLRQSDAVIAHDAESALAGIKAPTQITFGRRDVVTSTRFADATKNGIGRSEMTVFESCAHAPIYENVGEFNEKTLSFLKRNAG
jgi:pimeloyl-ACP methyl ester carboxylesterase